jgi:2-beta-glucuronyltransferase
MNAAAAIGRKPGRALLFTQQFVGLGTRKTGMVFWAETLAQMGWDTHCVTTQLSWLSRLLNPERLKAVPPADLNRWVKRGGTLSTFVWVPALHPVKTRWDGVDRASAALADIYARSLPAAIRAVAEDADLIVLESCAAVALFDRLRALAPKARIVFCCSDRLGAVGMHPTLQKRLDRTASRYDLIRVPSPSMIGDFPADARVVYIPHGVDKTVFDRVHPSPYEDGRTNALVGGDMAFDRESVALLVQAFPHVDFHFFGKMAVGDLATRANVNVHGEVAFEKLVPFIQHADVGVAPYRARPDLDYLAESSLKLHQYTYCRLPTIAPAFARGGREHIIPYEPGSEASIREAMAAALDYPSERIDRTPVIDWKDVMHRLVTTLDEPAHS